MPSKRLPWEGVILLVGVTFTALIGVANILVALLDLGTVPWLLLLIVSIGIGLAFRYAPVRGRPTTDDRSQPLREAKGPKPALARSERTDDR